MYYTFRFRVVAVLALYFLRKGRIEEKNCLLLSYIFNAMTVL